jgi:2-keto-4-pentenoate hydratase
MKSCRIILVAVGLALSGCAVVPVTVATCPGDEWVSAMVSDYLALKPINPPEPNMTIEGARCGAAKFTAKLRPSLGKVVGYKAGLTNPVVQQRFNYAQPVRGTLLEKMILSDGAEIPARFGARPVMESDLVVEVGSSAIMDASTVEQAVLHLRAIRPFIELPDLMLADPSKHTGASIELSNVGARLGVLGPALPVNGRPELVNALRDMTVRTFDGTGKEINAARGAAILGNPLNAVLWLVADLKKAGIVLKPGDLLSLGSFSPPLPVAAGGAARVVYEGLPGNPSVSVRFR